MGRSPTCSKDGLNKGAWTAAEDKILLDYVKFHGEGKWSRLSRETGKPKNENPNIKRKKKKKHKRHFLVCTYLTAHGTCTLYAVFIVAKFWHTLYVRVRLSF